MIKIITRKTWDEVMARIKYLESELTLLRIEQSTNGKRDEQTREQMARMKSRLSRLEREHQDAQKKMATMTRHK